MIDKELYDSAERGKLRRGKNDLLKHLQGLKITQRHAIWAKCYDCSGMGEADTCDTKECPLHPFSQYKVK